MADLGEIDRALPVNIVGRSASTGLDDNYLDIDVNGYLGARLYSASGSAINLGQTTMAGSIPVVFASDQSALKISNFPTTADTNYGTVGASTIRTASQIGNATGGALFGAGTTTAQVLRVVLPTDQTGIGSFLDKTGSGTITALNATVVATTSGCSTVTFDVTGTWVATIVIEGTTGDGNWFAINGDVDVNDSISGSFTANTFVTVPCGSFPQVRVRASAFTSGTVSVNWNSGAGSNTVEVFNTNASSLLVTASQGSAAALSGYWPVIITDGTNTMPTGDVAARGIFHIITDGTNTAAVKAASTAPTATDPALVVTLSPNSAQIVISPLPASGSKFSFGRITTSSSTQVPVEETTYTEQTTNGQRSLASSNAGDISGGTGARTVLITYYDQTGAGPFMETVTMAGTATANTVSTTICYIESLKVTSVGSAGSNQGTITLFTAINKGGTTITTIGVGDSQTFHAHHYVPLGKTCYISGFSIGNNATSAGAGALFILKASTPTVANSQELQVSDFVTVAGAVSTDTRTYNSPIQVAGPARVRAYVAPYATSTTTQYASFDYIDN